MTGWSWLPYLVLGCLAIAFPVWLYLRREPAGPGRPVLAALRALILLTIVLLLLDPLLPGRRRERGRTGAQLLLDASASMALPERAGDTTSRWTAALREVRRRRGDVLLFGARVRPLAADSLPASPPGDERTLVLPALRAAAEAGADRVVVVTDGGLEGAGTLPSWLTRLGVDVQWVTVGEPLGGLSLPGVSAPAWSVAGEPVTVQAVVAASAPAAGSTRVQVRQDGRVLADTAIAAPSPGSSVTLQLPVRPLAPREPGWVRLEVALQPGDALRDDDRRWLAMFVSPEPAGVTLVSLRPDQEPRFLLPVLGRALGIPASGYLRTSTGWVRAGGVPRAGHAVPEAEVRRAVAGAQLLVLQPGGAELPGWLADAAGSGRPLLVLGAAGGLPLPVSPAAEVGADWFLAPEVPPSPVAGLLADIPAAELPPLPGLYPVTTPAGAWAPLLVTRGRAGPPRPLLLAGETGSRRWAVALGEGYWRWAFPGGSGRDLYDRLWSAVGGWLLETAGAPGEAVRPVERVVPRGQASRWLVSGGPTDSLRLQVTAASGRVALDTVLRAPAGDTLQAPVLPPGEYRFRASAFAGERRLAGQGDLTVETWSPELARPRVAPRSLSAADRVAGTGAARGGRRPLHTSPVPYVLLVLLLSAEWVLRRRWGLR